MMLLSATVRNYRIHRELTVDFDRSRTLIGGPNESGKSTLMEAIHRGLFLKATVTGDARASMESTLYPGHPEVEIRFEVRGAEYQLTKRFSGQTGTTRLVQVGGPTWQGEDAQSRLTELLGVSETSSGRGILDRVSQQWAHLWVWQGASGSDPAEHFASQQACLLQQLQQVGGAVAMQSDLDSRVASRFSQARNQIYTQALAAKRGSELDKAQIDVQQAVVERDRASARVDGLAEAASAFEEASSTIRRMTADLEVITRQRHDLDGKIFQLEELRRREEVQVSAAANVAEKLKVLEGAEAAIADLRVSIEALQKSLKPMEEEQARLEAKFADCRRRRDEADQAHDKALEKTRDVRVARELAAAYVTRFQKQKRSTELQTRLEHVRRLQGDLDALRSQMAQLVPVDQEGLRALNSLENRLAQASAAVNAMATEVEVVAADRGVRIGEAQLAAGDSRTVSDLTEVVVGDSVRLRIHPGGGDSLAQARETVRQLEADLRRSLDGYGLESVVRATEIVAQRIDLKGKEASVVDRLREWNAQGLEEDCRRADAEHAGAVADVARRSEQVSGARQPSTLQEAEERLEQEETALAGVESAETASKAERDDLRQQLAGLETGLAAARETISAENQKLTASTAQLNLLISNHGADGLRARAVQDARGAVSDADGALATTHAALAALQPDLLEADRARLQRAWEEAEAQRQSAETRRAVSQAALRSDGSEDPVAELTRAEARLEAANEHLRAVSRKASAIALVDELFQQEQQTLADQFSQPLAEKISSYLRCLFGPDARTEVRFEDNCFRSLQLVRAPGQGAVSFSSLSGGTREQVAAAVRLAIAELLAADHDGTLPVVFDDSFAYSDPERVRTLQRMLDFGAARGLQVIVLTCNPSDYAALGARQVILR